MEDLTACSEWRKIKGQYNKEVLKTHESGSADACPSVDGINFHGMRWWDHETFDGYIPCLQKLYLPPTYPKVPNSVGFMACIYSSIIRTWGVTIIFYLLQPLKSPLTQSEL